MAVTGTLITTALAKKTYSKSSIQEKSSEIGSNLDLLAPDTSVHKPLLSALESTTIKTDSVDGALKSTLMEGLFSVTSSQGS